MSFYSKVPVKTPQDLWEELSEIKARMIQTIPFDSSIDKMEGFICVAGKEDELPVISICVQNPSKDKCMVTNIVFRSRQDYESFLNTMTIDFVNNFNIDNFN
jgi:hypothetical protein